MIAAGIVDVSLHVGDVDGSSIAADQKLQLAGGKHTNPLQRDL